MESAITIQTVYTSLEQVMDPEIPVLNVLELGMITDVQLADEHVLVKMVPTFAACPAIEVIKQNIKSTLEKDLHVTVQVIVDKTVQWNSNRLTTTAKDKLRNFGIAAPQQHDGDVTTEMIMHTNCPHCGSENTYLRSPFGSTLCRAMHFCKHCNMMFEQFKPLS
jgi:ring-1,2-phenylacetyl-CoA epoxidase subunit PaaD